MFVPSTTSSTIENSIERDARVLLKGYFKNESIRTNAVTEEEDDTKNASMGLVLDVMYC